MTETAEELPRTFGKIAKALAAFQAEAPTVGKNKTANTGTYTYAYADLADITEAAYPLLAAHGLAFTARPLHGELYGMLIHESGEYVDGSLPIMGTTMQQLGSSITYGRRYLFGCLTGIVTDADDDGNAASAKPKSRQPRKQPQEEPAAPYAGSDRISDAQTKKLAIVMKEAGIVDRGDRLKRVAEIIGRTVESSSDLTKGEASKVIDLLAKEKRPAQQAIDEANRDPWEAR